MNGCPVCFSDDTEHTPGEGCSYLPDDAQANAETSKQAEASDTQTVTQPKADGS